MHAFAVLDCHHHGCEDGVDKQDGTCDARIHVVISEIEQGRRACHEHPQQEQFASLMPVDSKADALPPQHHSEHGQREQISEEQDGPCIHPSLVERKGKERVQSIEGRGQNTCHVACMSVVLHL